MDNAVILKADNTPLSVTNLTPELGGAATNFGSLIFGSVADSATGEVGLKVIDVGSSAASVVGSAAFAVTHVTALANGTASLATRTGRRGFSIRCLTASPEAIYYGPTTGVTAVSGAKLGVGESQNVDTSAACFVMSAAGTGLVEFVETY